jgi:sugar/nucleoside kinase (ribokinase family)
VWLGVAQIMVDTTTGNNIIIVVPGSNATISIEEINLAERLISDAKFISFGLEGNHDAVIAALEIAKRNGVRTMTNAAPARHDLHPKYAITILSTAIHMFHNTVHTQNVAAARVQTKNLPWYSTSNKSQAAKMFSSPTY